MGLFGKILDKLGLGEKEPAAGRATVPVAVPVRRYAPSPASTAPSTPPRGETPLDFPDVPPPVPVAVVDVVALLEKRAQANPQKLNWRTSIVDLLKLLDIDSSFAARKELAKELDCPAALMGDSAKMNVWLHKTVLARIAENGGNVPADLLD